KATELRLKLVKDFGIDEKEAVQIVNCMPESIEELRIFLPKHRVIETEKLQKMVELINSYRK
ncbi:MAG: RNA polymerase Rpb4, partial [Candidatus Hecatellales archaeon ex4484_218]